MCTMSVVLRQVYGSFLALLIMFRPQGLAGRYGRMVSWELG